LLNTILTDRLTFLQDKSSTGRERPWRLHKQQSLVLADSYNRLGNEKRYISVSECGAYLCYEECSQGHERKLKMAHFCKVRLCPMCAWRRSLVLFKQLSDILHEVQSRDSYRFLLLTISAKTVRSYELNDELKRYFDSWKRFANLRTFKGSVAGWFRALEITHDVSKDTYHPHFHVLLAVKPGYFSGGRYIKQKQWCDMWQQSMRLDYEPIVDIRVVKPRKEGQTVEGSVLEVAKYTVKSGDYIKEHDKRGMDRAVKILDESLFNRRLVAYGGIFKNIRKELKHQDIEKADLVNIDEESKSCKCNVCNSDLMEVVYKWHIGYRNYVKVPDMDSKVIDSKTGEILVDHYRKS
jgi:plasmid rolling circle replication initiator protein Rep